ncbi:MAG: pseudouridine synthase [Candidatus Absconditicoccaceae bacterium]
MELTITPDQANQRCDRFLRKFCKPYPQVRLSDIYSWIRKGEIKVNGKKTKEETRLHEGDLLELPESLLGAKDKQLMLTQKEKKFQKLDPKLVKSWILYEDQQRLAFNKPAGIVLHPSNKHRNDLCMNDYLERYCSRSEGQKEEKNQTFKPSFGYRLDKDTSGVLIAAKTYESLQYINQIIRERAISKEYLTRVAGKFPKHLIIDKAIEKTYNAKFARAQMQLNESDGLDSKTECRCEKTLQHNELGQISLVRVKLYSGRMHQIRIHLASENFPVLGDLIYGKPAINRIVYKSLHIQRQLLHCWKYQFKNLNGKLIAFEAPLPQEFKLFT